MTHPHPHDVVVLERDFGRWPAGTVGAVVEESPSGVVVELVGPGGETLELLDVPAHRVRVVEDLGGR